jgi:hypothetical protein
MYISLENNIDESPETSLKWILYNVSGIKGITGNKGETGILGRVGWRGATGLKGATGATGISGLIGVVGRKGDNGIFKGLWLSTVQYLINDVVLNSDEKYYRALTTNINISPESSIITWEEEKISEPNILELFNTEITEKVKGKLYYDSINKRLVSSDGTNWKYLN